MKPGDKREAFAKAGIVLLVVVLYVLGLGVLSWISDLFYGWGLWPFGAAARLLALAYFLGGLIFLIRYIFNLLRDVFEQEDF